MRLGILIVVFLISPLFLAAQTQYFGSCFGKQNRKSIDNKIDNFLTRVSEETGCAKEKLTFSVDEYYTIFYSKSCRHLPKTITVDACGEKRTYLHRGLSGNITYWLLGSWALKKEKT